MTGEITKAIEALNLLREMSNIRQYTNELNELDDAEDFFFELESYEESAQ